jgi:hypothetical protein
MFLNLYNIVKYHIDSFDLPYIPEGFPIYEDPNMETMVSTIEEYSRLKEFSTLSVREYNKACTGPYDSSLDKPMVTLKQVVKSFGKATKEYNDYFNI